MYTYAGTYSHQTHFNTQRRCAMMRYASLVMRYARLDRTYAWPQNMVARRRMVCTE